MTTELTGAAKRQLRQTGKTLEAAATIGKDGLSEGAVANVSDLLDRRELIKVRLPGGAVRKTIAAELAEKTGANLIATVGRTCVLYRPNPELPADERIVVL